MGRRAIRRCRRSFVAVRTMSASNRWPAPFHHGFAPPTSPDGYVRLRQVLRGLAKRRSLPSWRLKATDLPWEFCSLVDEWGQQKSPSASASEGRAS